MAEIKPFRGIRYNNEKIGDISLVVAPVYDVIEPAERDHYYQRHPQNIIRLILPERISGRGASSRYEYANKYFREWRETGVLVQDPTPYIYLYRQLYIHDGELKEATGMVVRVGLEEFDGGTILPHENILEKPLEDRTRLLEACRANFSQILAFYSDPEGKIPEYLTPEMEHLPLEQFQAEDGVSHTIWGIDNQRLVKRITRELEEKSLLIADGHHRYQTALNLSREWSLSEEGDNEGAPYRYVMMLLWRMEDPGITLLPVHRMIHDRPECSAIGLLRSADRWFEIEEVEVPSGALSGKVYFLLKRLEEIADEGPVFGMYSGQDNFYMLKWRRELEVHGQVRGVESVEYKRLDVTVLHRTLIEDCLGISSERSEVEKHIAFIKNPITAAREVDLGKGELVFFLNPVRVKEVREVAGNGERMPQKSTYFYPKPLSGTVINPITEE